MKNSIGWIVLALIILLGVIYVINRCEDKPKTEVPPNDTLYVYGDTLWIPQDTVWAVRWKKVPAVTTINTAGVVTKSITKDTLLVVGKDSIKVEATAEYNLSEDTFDMGIDIDFRGYDSFRVDTLNVTKYIPVEVEVTDPMWIIIAAGEFVIIVAGLVLAIMGGG